MPHIIHAPQTHTPPSLMMRLASKIPFAHLVYGCLLAAYIAPAIIDGSLWVHLNDSAEMSYSTQRKGYVEQTVLEALRPSQEMRQRYTYMVTR